MVICRIAFAWFQLAISMMPCASCSALMRAGKPRGERGEPGAGAGDVERDGAADQGGRNAAQTRLASVMVGSAPPFG